MKLKKGPHGEYHAPSVIVFESQIIIPVGGLSSTINYTEKTEDLGLVSSQSLPEFKFESSDDGISILLLISADNMKISREVRS